METITDWKLNEDYTLERKWKKITHHQQRMDKHENVTDRKGTKQKKRKGKETERERTDDA